MKIVNYTPEKYEGSELASIAGAINIGFYLLPFFLLVVLVRQLIQLDFDMSIVISAGIAFALITRHIFLRGNLRRAVMMVAVFFTLLLTLVCSLGNGIHDIGIIGFPIIIGFSSIILDQKQLVVASILSIVGLAWLVLGDRFDIFEPVPVPSGNAGDFVISSLLIIMGGFVAFSLTSNMKDSLKKANREVSASKKEADKLIKEIDEKEDIIKEIHRAVINSLNHIRHLIDYQGEDKDQLHAVYRSLERKIMVIEAAHETLLQEQEHLQLELGNFTRVLLSKFEKELKTPILQISAAENTCIVSLDQAIYYGIAMLEILLEADKHNATSLKVDVQIADSKISLDISGLKDAEYQKEGLIMDLLTQQLKGELKRSPTGIELTFKAKTMV